MSWFRKVVLKLVRPGTARAMEEESRRWNMRCPCGGQISVWDAGGLRYKAAGNPRRKWVCAACGERTWHTLSQRPRDPAAGE
jgi:hypothetical protein